MNIDSFKKRLEGIYWLNSLLPVMIIYIINSFFFTTPFFREYIQPVTQIVMTVYAVFLAAYCIISGKIWQGNRLLIGAMLIFSIINFLSFLITKEASGFYSLSIVFMIPVNYLAFGLPRIDIPEKQRREEIESVIYVFLIFATVWNIFLLLIEGNTNGLVDILSGNRRLSGISENPNRLGYFTSTAVFFSVYCFLISKKLWGKILICFAFVYNLFILYLTGNRSSQIFLLVVLCLLFLIISYKRYSKKVFCFYCVSIVLLVLIGSIYIVLSRGFEENSSIYESINQSSSGRIDLYLAGIQAGIKSPIWGNSYSYLCEQYFPNTMAHNLYIDLFARYGIISLLTFFVFIGALIVYSICLIKKTSKYSFESADYLLFVFCFILIIGYLIQHLFDIFIFLSGYSAGNVFFIICSGYLAYHISKADFKLNKR